MSDLTPFFLSAREARQESAEAAAGQRALSQFGYLPAALAEPASGELKVQTDVEKIETGNIPGQRSRTGPAPEPALKLRNAPLPERAPGEGAERVGFEQRVPYSDALNLLTTYIANTENPEEFRQKMIEAFQKDPREFEAGLEQLLIATGLSMPAVNAMMRLAKDELTQAGAPYWAATAGEFLAGALVPSRMAIGAAGKAAKAGLKIYRQGGRLVKPGAASIERVRAAMPSDLSTEELARWAAKTAAPRGEGPSFEKLAAYTEATANPESFQRFMQRGRYAVLSAEKQGLPEAENAANTAGLLKDLLAQGYHPVPAKEMYGGAPEASFFVPGMDEADALALGKKYSQESVFTPRGLLYTADESLNPADLSRIDFSGAQTDYFTSLKIGEQEMKFTVPIDFEKKIAKGGAVETPKPTPSGPQALIEAAGARFDGTSDLGGGAQGVWFTDPRTGSTLMLPTEEASAENIALHLAESRRAWGIEPPSAGQIGAAGAGAAAGAMVESDEDPYAGTGLGAAIGIGTGNLKLLRSPGLPQDMAKLVKGRRLWNALVADGAARLARGGVKAWQARMTELGVPAEQLEGILAQSKEIAGNGLKQLRKDLVPLETAFPFWRAAEGRPDWYDTPAMLKQAFGPDADLMARLLAATSPQQNAARANIDAALGVYEVLKTRPENEWRTAISSKETTRLFGVSGKNTVPNVWRAIEGKDLSGNKVNDFYRALIGDESVFTVDRHIARLIAPENLAIGAGEINDAEYTMLSNWGKQFAQSIGESPRYTQQRLWVGYRLIQGLEEGNEVFFENLVRRAKDQGILDLVPRAPFLDEAGRSRVGVAFSLSGAAIGAVTGGSIGDTTEERFQNAAIGLGAGALSGAQLSRVARWLETNAPAVRHLVRKPLTQYPPEIGQRLDRLFSNFDADLAAFTRGHRPHSQAWDEAEQMIRSGRMSLDDVKASFPGHTLNDAEAMAFIKTVADYGTEVQAFAQGLQSAVRAGNPLSPEQVDQLLTRLYTMRELLPRPRGIVAEAGRTLSAMNEPTHGLNQYLAEWNLLFTDPSKSLDPEKLVDILSQIKRPDQYAAIARLQQQPGWTDMAIEGLYSALLLNPISLEVNAAMNTAAMAYTVIERAAGAVVGDTVHWLEPFALAYGYTKAVPQAFRNAGHVLLIGERRMAGGSKVEVQRAVTGATHDWLQSTWPGRIAEAVVPTAIGAGYYGMTGNLQGAVAAGVSSWPLVWPVASRVMSSADDLAKTMLFEGEKWAQAVRRTYMIPDPKLRRQKFAEIIQNPNSVVQRAGESFANEFTFNAPPGPIVQGILNGINDPNLPGPYKALLRTTVPFVTVPNNMLKFIGRRTPGLSALHASYLADLRSQGARSDIALGQLTLGAAWLASVAGLAANGYFTGSGPADPNLLREWIADGNQEYSFRPPGSDKSFSINRTDPFGGIVSIISDWSAISAHIGDAANDQIAMALLMVVSKDMTSKSYFEGGSEFLQSVVSHDPNKAYRWLYQFAGTPVPSALKQLRQIQDPYLREVRDLVDAEMNKLPDFSKNLPPRKNVFAEPIINHEPIGYGIDYVNPFYARTRRNDPAIAAVLENRISVSMPGWSVYGGQDKAWTLDPQRESVGVPLTPRLRDELIDLMGRPLKRAWLEFVQSKDYDPRNLGPDSANALVFRELHRTFRDAAVAELTDKHPELLKGLEEALDRRARSLETALPPRQPQTGPSILERLMPQGAR